MRPPLFQLPAGHGLEIASFELKEGVSEAELQHAAQQIDADWLRHETGYQGYALLRGEERRFIHLTLADSPERARQLCAQWPAEPACRDFLAAIAADTGRMDFYHCL
ncbi:hypothetical protein HNO92_000914 [Chromobacterium alkanivorans]|uniref:hypothetical protein n=1 Tax=Chromobacterium alkanivorans TaxID=1071719 RepID=UPI00216780DE|nr:hypothetical protein [Chromobacterium alkanivorans]MCS3803254.1 hypothetical protein [Chromobacterium alkanivorans]MCS3817636.1 hypothetical protein [Chromobacterium alkanivorans]MCS3872620.1 hypothetical protein [Chromobacterium alkanivorans]